MTETSLTDVEIAEMCELEAICSPGPWTHNRGDARIETPHIGDQCIFNIWHEVNREFVATARTFVPKALSAIAELKAENARLRAKLSFTDGDRLANELPGD